MNKWNKKLRAKFCNIIAEMLNNPDKYNIHTTTKCYDELEELMKQEIKDFADELKIRGYYNKSGTGENKYLLYDENFDELLKGERGIE